MKDYCITMLWGYACSGDIEGLKEYYNNGGTTGKTYFKFGEHHSLIMGAFRNRQYEVVDYLLSVGEKVTEKEWNEINLELQRIESMKKIAILSAVQDVEGL